MLCSSENPTESETLNISTTGSPNAARPPIWPRTRGATPKRPRTARAWLWLFGGVIPLAAACGAESERPNLEGNSGVAENAILGGQADTADAYRSVVYVNGCSGVLLSPYVIATAAHCYGEVALGCKDYRIDQPGVPNGWGGHTVLVPKPGNSVIVNPPDGTMDTYRVAAVRVAPDYASPVVDDCCGGNPDPAACMACPTEDLPWQPNNKVHDIALVYLEEPILDVAPEDILLNVGSQGRYGTFDVDLDAIGVVLLAGTSRMDTSTRQRATAGALVQSTNYPAGPDDPSPTSFYDTSDTCDFDASENTTYMCANCSLNYASHSPGCFVEGDSGGPTFLIGGSGGAGLPGGERVVIGLHSAASTPDLPSSGADCDLISFNRDTATWDHSILINGEPRPAHKGTLIRATIFDFDMDGVANEFDNCSARGVERSPLSGSRVTLSSLSSIL